MKSLSSRHPGLHVVGLLGFTSVVGTAGCAGEDADGPSNHVTESAHEVPAALVAESWQARLVDDAARAPFEQHAAWGVWFNRDLRGALAEFSSDPAHADAAARVHTELANLYRQAALMGAHATVLVYETDAQETDPAEVGVLLASGHGLLGSCEGATSSLAELSLSGDASWAASHTAWSSWVSEGCVWPPSAPAAVLAELPEVVVGTAPTLGGLPHHTFAETSDEALEIEASDPSVLLALGAWHEAAALQAAPERAELIAQVSSPWALPPEPEVAGEVLDVPDIWLFGGFAMNAADIAFVAAARTQGLAAIDSWSDRSPQARALSGAVEDGKLDPEKVMDAAAALSTKLSAQMTQRGGGEQGFHRPFADLAEAGVLRAGMVVAHAEGESRDSGVLRINLFDEADAHLADPVFLMSTAAWHTGNRSPQRAQETVHRLVRTYPSVEAARYPLDALHVRLSRTAAPSGAAH